MLSQAIAVINGKGGTGKTSLVTNLAGVAAVAGYRVLVVDLDPQTNTSNDLGYDKKPWANGLLNCLTLSQPLPMLRDVRPGLDVVPAGKNLAKWSVHAALNARSDPRNPPELALERMLLALSDDYDLVLFDCPPGNEELQLLALAAARFTLIPFMPDDASIEGLEEVSDRFERARIVNPDLELLGVVLFGVPSAAKRVRAEALDKVTTALGESLLLNQSVRGLQAPAVGARNRHQLAHEYEADADTQEPFYAALRHTREGGESLPVARLAGTASTLAADYQNVTAEVLQRMKMALAVDEHEPTAV
ncbi:ParA family protein [Pengzhenrongella sp.]|uniref:ParA family protein n=1 Tax=Pengzhenrongella sp. TaxID=2888820 RepID=UPI002F930115